MDKNKHRNKTRIEGYSIAEVVGVYAAKVMNIINYVVLVRGIDWDHKILPIFIGEPEAASIDAAMKGFIPKRPLTHDLIISLLDTLGVKIEKVTIDAMVNNIYTATIVLVDERQGKKVRYHIDARPSDSIAIALRAGTTIYIADHLKKYAVDEGELGILED